MDANPASERLAELPSRVVCVLGMHRSGTSCLTGSLQEAGLFLGDCHTWNPHNLKGNRENQNFVDLHDDILQENGGAWDAPPRDAVWSERHSRWAFDLLRDNASMPVFGFKDPRALLVLAGWKAVFPHIEFVGICRHPNEVVRSLAKRGAIEREKALHLWYTYNRVLYREYKKKPFPLLCFDDDEEVLQDKISRVAVQLELVASKEAQNFYSPELRTARNTQQQSLPWKVRLLYHKLKSKCL
jgi:hypothetical protein